MNRDHPPLIVFDEDKAVYYDALAAYDKFEDLEPMEAFLKQQTEKTWEKTLERERRQPQPDCEENAYLERIGCETLR